MNNPSSNLRKNIVLRDALGDLRLIRSRGGYYRKLANEPV